MELKDFLTLVIATWGAVLSTILGLHELRKEKSRLLIVLELVAFCDQMRLIIHNTGFQPVTITGVTFELLIRENNPEMWETVRHVYLFKDNNIIDFPVTILPGSSISSDLHNTQVYGIQDKIRVVVKDIHGKECKEFKKYVLDEKIGLYYPYEEQK